MFKSCQKRLDFHIFAIANIILAYCSKGNNKSFADYQSLQVVAPTIHTSYNIFLQFAKMPTFEKNLLPTLSKLSLSRAACNHSKPNSAVVEYMHLSKTWKFLVEKLENHICLDYKSLQLCVVPISRNLIRHIICSLSISLFFKIEKRIKIYKNFREKTKTWNKFIAVSMYRDEKTLLEMEVRSVFHCYDQCTKINQPQPLGCLVWL